jgi:hypothetical protein
MGAAAKVVIGLVLLVIGFGLFADSPGLSFWKSVTGIDWLGSFITLLAGLIPIFLILLGLLVVWLEVDEMKMKKELKRESKAEKSDKKKK